MREALKMSKRKYPVHVVNTRSKNYGYNFRDVSNIYPEGHESFYDQVKTPEKLMNFQDHLDFSGGIQNPAAIHVKGEKTAALPTEDFVNSLNMFITNSLTAARFEVDYERINTMVSTWLEHLEASFSDVGSNRPIAAKEYNDKGKVSAVITPVKGTRLRPVYNDGVLQVFSNKATESHKIKRKISFKEKENAYDAIVAPPSGNLKQPGSVTLTEKQQVRRQKSKPMQRNQQRPMTQKGHRHYVSANAHKAASLKEVKDYVNQSGDTHVDNNYKQCYMHLVAHSFKGGTQIALNLVSGAEASNIQHSNGEGAVRYLLKNGQRVALDPKATCVPGTHIGIELFYPVTIKAHTIPDMVLPFHYDLQAGHVPNKASTKYLSKLVEEVLKLRSEPLGI